MEDRFLNLDENKRIMIINSAMDEFSKNSYDKASTNRIVEKAGISKGSLFHYFQNKKMLYEYLKSFSIREIAQNIIEEVNWEEPDLLKRVREITFIKLKIFRKYPYLIGFTQSMNAYQSIEELKALYEAYIPNIYEKVYTENIDFSLFREDIAVKEVINIFIWTFEKLGEKYFNKIKMGEIIDVDQMAKETDQYIDTLRKGFYQ